MKRAGAADIPWTPEQTWLNASCPEKICKTTVSLPGSEPELSSNIRGNR
jgi:hypothetical protein